MEKSKLKLDKIGVLSRDLDFYARTVENYAKIRPASSLGLKTSKMNQTSHIAGFLRLSSYLIIHLMK